MSVKAMSRVWDRSRAKGSELLVLLAIADYAEDDGRNAWPTMKVLAEKSRMSERGLRYVLDRLIAAGELLVEPNDGKRRVTDGVVPRQFFHVACCRRRDLGGPAKIADEPANIADVEPARIAHSEQAKIADEPAKIAETSTGNPLQTNRQTAAVQPANGDTHIERSVTDPSLDPSPRARERTTRRKHPLDEQQVLEPWALDMFDELWALYPAHKELRLQSERAWIGLNPSRELASFIVEHVRLRLKGGWAQRPAHELRFLPSLRTFLDERRWLEQFVADAVPPAAARQEGMLVMRSCSGCGETLEGRVANGQSVFPPCPRCASAGLAAASARGKVPAA